MSTGDPVTLIVGQTPDIHIETVAGKLRDLGQTVLLLDRHGPDTVSLGLGSSPDCGSLLTTRDGSARLADIKAVWWRVKPASPVEFAGGSGQVADQFRWSEWRQMLASLHALTPQAVWFNDPDAHRQASRKPVQLLRAKETGFDIPDTVIGNDPDDVLGLFQRHRRVIYKTLSSYLIPPHDIIYTNEITRENVEANRDGIRLAPGIFQEYIEKRYELRVTVVGERIFTCRIESQSDALTSTDWRRNQFRDMYCAASLPADTEERLLRLHRRFGLHYGAYDLIAAEDGRIVFLECNPGGQWLFVENATNLPITQALAGDFAVAAGGAKVAEPC